MTRGERHSYRFDGSEGCDRHCENCERFLDCDAQAKEIFKKRGVFALARENLKLIKHKVALVGGKDGVGKSTLTVNLAAAMVKKGLKVCILDQVHGYPSIPLMLGIENDARLRIGEHGLLPAESACGVKVVSIGLILDPDEVIVWFHNMRRSANEELLCAVDYGELDYLLIDVPAGTGKETVDAIKYIPDIDGAVVINSASEAHRHAITRFICLLNKAGIPLLGLVENMADSTSLDLGQSAAILLAGARLHVGNRRGAPFLAKLKMSEKIRDAVDVGEPAIVRYPGSRESRMLMDVCDAVIASLEQHRQIVNAE